MKTFRILLGILAIIPASLLIGVLILDPANYSEGSLGEMLYLLFGIPILTLNYWAWLEPEIIRFYFLGNEEQIL